MENKKETKSSPCLLYKRDRRTNPLCRRAFVFIPQVDGKVVGGRESERREQWKTRVALANHVHASVFHVYEAQLRCLLGVAWGESGEGGSVCSDDDKMRKTFISNVIEIYRYMRSTTNLRLIKLQL